MLSLAMFDTLEALDNKSQTVLFTSPKSKLKPGDLLQLVTSKSKYPKGEAIPIGNPVRVVSVKKVLIKDIDYKAQVKAGYGRMSREDFKRYLSRTNRAQRLEHGITQVEFKYLKKYPTMCPHCWKEITCDQLASTVPTSTSRAPRYVKQKYHSDTRDSSSIWSVTSITPLKK